MLKNVNPQGLRRPCVTFGQMLKRMKKHIPKAGFYGLAIIAMAGLISAQVYWIKSDYAMQEDSFKRDLSNALNNTIDEVEKRDNEKLYKMTTINLSLETGGKKISEMSEKDFEDLHKRIIERADKSISLLKSIQKTKTLDQHVSKWELNSILANHLKLCGINMDYEFVVVDAYKKPLMFKNKEAEKLMDKFDRYGYTVPLYSFDKSGAQVFLSVYFPNESGFILSKIWMPVASSLLSMLILIFLLMRSQIKPKQREEFASC